MNGITPTPVGVAIVTGASSGIGASFARRLAAAAGRTERYPALPGFDELWLTARRGDRLEELAGELRAAAPTLTVRTFPLDLAAAGSLAPLTATVAEAATAGKPLRILINSAGFGTYGPFSGVALEKQLGELDLNCRALTEVCGRLDPHLAAGSLVINVASLAAFAPLGGFAVYAASKAYVLSFSVALAAEWEERGIRVCALCPGSVASEFALVASGGVRKEVLHGWSADATTARCLRDAARGNWISMPRLLWRFKRFAGWLFGPVISARFAQRFMRRPHAGDQPR